MCRPIVRSRAYVGHELASLLEASSIRRDAPKKKKALPRVVSLAPSAQFFSVPSARLSVPRMPEGRSPPPPQR